MAARWRPPAFAMDATQYRMLASLRQSIETITKSPNGMYTVEKNHHLKGLFVQLIDPSTMRQILFPGSSPDVLAQLPRNVREVLQWTELSLDLLAISSSAAEVLTNIKKKGAKVGDIMDEMTEQVLLPQIAQEALARAIVENVRQVNRKISKEIATNNAKVASIDDHKAHEDVLDEIVVQSLRNHYHTVQTEYMGREWANVIRKDLIRYIRDEELSIVDETGEVIVENSTAHKRNMRMAWLDINTPYIQKTYPAIYEAISFMHMLPYELNAKTALQCDDSDKQLSLLEPVRGSSMLVYFPSGCTQKLRLDCRTDLPEADSGIRLTACYHLSKLIPPAYPEEVQRNPYALPPPPRRDGSKLTFHCEGKTEDVLLEDDLLSLHRSDLVKNERSFVAGKDGEGEWFALYFFLHAREIEKTIHDIEELEIKS